MTTWHGEGVFSAQDFAHRTIVVLVENKARIEVPS